MPGMMQVAETWMVTASDVLGKPLAKDDSTSGGFFGQPRDDATRRRRLQTRRNWEILERVRLLRLGDTYNLRRFASASAKQLCKLECRDLRAVLAEYRALGSDEELQNGQYFMHELVAQMRAPGTHFARRLGVCLCLHGLPGRAWVCLGVCMGLPGRLSVPVPRLLPGSAWACLGMPGRAWAIAWGAWVCMGVCLGVPGPCHMLRRVAERDQSHRTLAPTPTWL
jgi:hypothetical protein